MTFTLREGAVDGPEIGTYEWNPPPSGATPQIGDLFTFEGLRFRVLEAVIHSEPRTGVMAVKRVE